MNTIGPKVAQGEFQVILFEIDRAIFYENFHELFCKVEQNLEILVNLWTISEYHVKLWLI